MTVSSSATSAQNSDALPTPLRVFYAEAVYGEEEIQAAVDVLRNQRHALMNGPKVAEFERAVAELFGTSKGLMVNSGSSANLLAVDCLGLERGSEVITTALTFSTTVAPIIQLGLVPVFVDCLPDTYCVDPAQVEEMIGPKTKAIMVPNLIGNVAPLVELREIADRHGLYLIEDSADTIGATLGGEPTGRFADVSTTSFYASHIVTGAGFGGMVCVSDDELAERAQLLRGWGRSSSIMGETEDADLRFSAYVDDIRYDAKFLFSALGYNFLPSEISAAFGLVQLSKLADNTARRRKNFDTLHRFFADYGDWVSLPKATRGSVSPWLAFPMVFTDKAPFSRTDAQIHFEADGIQTRTVFTGNILRQPGFKNIERRERTGGYPEADRVMAGGVLLGCHHGLEDAHLDHLMASFRRLVAAHT